MAATSTVPRFRAFTRQGAVAGALAALVGLAFTALATEPSSIRQADNAAYRTFYIPSEAMMPTLLKQDRLLARMERPEPLRRGLIILFQFGASMWIKRLAALPGDRVEFADGEFILNGRRMPRRPLGEFPLEGVRPPGPAQLYEERLPGENGSHRILDHFHGPGDDFGPVVVPQGHVFVLGDNRDHSADSRFSHEEMGVEMLPISRIRGVARFIYWRQGDGFGNWPLSD